MDDARESARESAGTSERFALENRLAPGEGPRQTAGTPKDGTPSEATRESPGTPKDAVAAGGSPRPISIWQPLGGAEGTVWVRPEPGPLGDHYARRRVLAARRPGGPRRVCWFGESAAAGYLCAPHLTPARLLAAQLAAVSGAGAAADGWEVIDLARTNERLATLAATVEAAAQLAPDHLVVYAGNNLRLLETPELSPFAPPGRRELAAVLAAEGAPGAARLARWRAAERTAVACERFADVASALGVPLTLVLPEVSLADWETRQPPVRLAGDGTARWHRLYAAARTALARRGAVAAETAAWRMIELDGGSCPTPFRLLAAAALAAGRTSDAHDAAVSEIDAVHYPLLACLAAPQAGTPERRVLSAVAARRGLATVDLRGVFAELSGGGGALPGRHLFLDYCHLTPAGMAVATAAVAAELLRQAGTELAADDRRRLAAKPAGRLVPGFTPAAEAVAYLGAAVHTAHRHLPVTDRGELIDHWCAAALGCDRQAAAAAMLDLADARTAPRPEPLGAAERRNLARPAPLTHQHGWRWPHLDGGLLAAMGRALAAAGRPEAAEIEALLAGRRALPAAGSELVHPAFHLARPVARLLSEAMAPEGLPDRATLRSAWPQTAFDLVLAAPAVVELTAVARLPEGGGGRVGVEIEAMADASIDEQPGASEPTASFRAGAGWRRATVRLAVRRAGLHRLTLRWPSPPPAGDAPLAAVARRLAEGREATLQPVFGELYSLAARVV